MFWNKPKTTGAWGEEQAEKYLQQQGYTILCRNFHSRYGEIDLIVTKDDIIAFVEVKTRGGDALYTAAEAVTAAKQNKIYLTALHYMEEYNADLQPRFDVCEVYVTQVKKKHSAQINYMEDAFQVPSYN